MILYKNYSKFILLILFTALSSFNSCTQSGNIIINGFISMTNNEFKIISGKAIYDVNITFESRVSFQLIYIYKDIKYTQNFEDIKTIKLDDIDLGKYYIVCKVKDLKGIPKIEYKIELTKKHYWYSERYESEPNDTYLTASDFNLSSIKIYSIIGRLSSKDDIDYYSIINNNYLDLNSIITISNPDDNFSAILFDENYNQITKFTKNLPFQFQSNKRYFLKITSRISDLYELPYTIIIKPVSQLNNLTEFEPNNETDNANRINLSQSIFGELNEKDVDFFRFDIEKDGFYKIIFSASSFPFSISLMTEFGEFYKDYEMHRAGSFRHLLLPKGKYFLKINRKDEISIRPISYSIKIENDSAAFEIEPNDDVKQANEFTIYDTVTGSISWEYDVDFFYIQFEKNENYIIISSEDPFTTLKCEIFDENKLISSFEIKEGALRVQLTVQKVIIKLSAVNFSKEIAYTIKVGN